jgi:hypothetical protein
MNKIFFPLLMVSMILLTACSASATGAVAGSTSNNLPVATELAVGTLKLAGTEQDITVDQAKDLVVYWQVYKELGQSQTAAQAEVDALIAQIEETMTRDQVQAITDMRITQQDVQTAVQGVSVTSSNLTSNTVSLPSASASGGGMPAGGPPADGGGAPSDGGISPEMGGAAPASSTNQVAQSGTSVTVTTGVSTTLVEAVIQSLEQKIAA